MDADVVSAAWLVRGGEKGEREDQALAEGLVIAGWEGLGDISGCATREGIRQALKEAYPEVSERVIGNWTGQLWRFKDQIIPGDLVVMPLKTRPGRIAIGQVSGPYEFRASEPEGFRQVRGVDWLNLEIARDSLRPDLQASITSLLTVCGLTRNDAARRLAHLVKYGTDPGMIGGDEITTSEELLDEAVARDPGSPRRLTIRSLLEHWGESRRTGGVVATIKADLAEKGLTTRPPFTEGLVESEITLVPVSSGPGVTFPDADTEDVEEQAPATLRIGSLPPAKLVSVAPNAELTYAQTIMVKRRFSQLAIIDDKGRYLGAVSWESIGRAHIASERPSLADCIIQVPVVDHDALLLEQIDLIYNQDFVFVRSADRSRVNGIVTAADLTRQFGHLARPFVLIEEAENRLRRRASEVYTLNEVRAAARPDQRRKINRVIDLMLGTYPYLMGNEENWAKLGWRIDRESFIECLNDVVEVRNKLVHFTPDPLPADKYEAVEGLLQMLRTVDPRP